MRDAADQEAAKRQARAVLHDLARRAELITYGELVRQIDAIEFNPRGSDFHQMLGEISKEDEAAGSGMLSAIVVTRETGRPGTGFFALAKQLGRRISDQDAFWHEELERVYEAHGASSRPTVAERAISVRLDGDAEKALDVLVRSGMTRSQAIRQALVDAADQSRRAALAAEARQLAADPDDRAGIAEIAAFMDALSAEG